MVKLKGPENLSNIKCINRRLHRKLSVEAKSNTHTHRLNLLQSISNMEYSTQIQSALKPLPHNFELPTECHFQLDIFFKRLQRPL